MSEARKREIRKDFAAKTTSANDKDAAFFAEKRFCPVARDISLATTE